MRSTVSLSLLFALALPAVASAQDKADLVERPADPAHRALLDQADAVLEVIGEQRGVPAHYPVESDVLTRDALRDRLIQAIAEEYPPEEIAEDERLLRAIDVLGRDQDYLQLTLDLLEDQIAGFYDESTETFYLIDDSPMEMQIPVMSHELFHAIQDQTWDIEALRGPTDTISDMALARTALIEGDALAVMMNYSMGGALDVASIPMLDQMMEGSMDPPDDTFPLMLWESLVYPYAAGLTFVLELYRQGGWDAVNAVYTSLPSSTEQILHPERYLDRDAPTWLTFETTPHLTRYNEDIMGEFGIASLLRQLIGEDVSERAIDQAAAGWDGDRMNGYLVDGDPDRDVVLWLSVWDTEADAGAFSRVIARVAQVWVPEHAADETSGAYGERVVATGPDGAMIVERWGDLVLVALDRAGSPSPEQRRTELEREVDAAWRSHARFAYPSE